MKKVLVVDDERAIIDVVRFNLEKANYEVIVAFDGVEAMKLYEALEPDLILLDLGLPRMAGEEVISEIRKYSEVPIIVISKKDSECDKALLLELGADDYITKPFSNQELLARVHAKLRRQVSEKSHEKRLGELADIRVGLLHISPRQYKVEKAGRAIELTKREFELLLYLAQHPGKAISRESLQKSVWGYDRLGNARTIDVTIGRLREKIEELPSRPEYICTRRGLGYYMSDPMAKRAGVHRRRL